MFRCLLVLLLLAVVVLAQNDVDLDLTFEQSIANGPWTSRGNVKFILKRSEKMLSVKLDNPTFEIKSQEDIAKLAEPTTFVRLRIPAVDSTGQIIPNQFLITSLRGCALLKDPKEVLSLITDKTGAISAIQYERPLAADCSAALPQHSLKLATKITAVMPKESPTLASGSSLPTNAELLRGTISNNGKDEDEQNEKEKTANPFQQSILVQYWYIFLPLFVAYTFMTAPAAAPAAAPEQEKKD